MNNRMLMIGLAIVLAGVVVTAALLPKGDAPAESKATVRVVLASEVDWQALNPLRGDKSPRAGTLWGDRQAPVPCGFLVKFVDGFSSPPHIHPVTYRGVVISGLVHNDLPDAVEEWLEAGTFWTQPAGEVHITAAKGSENVAYIEIEKGPYLVFPKEKAFARTETPIKMQPSAMPWTEAAGVQIAPLAGNPGDDTIKRFMLRLPAGFTGTLRSAGQVLHGVVITGRLDHEVAELSASQSLAAGAYFGSEGKADHQVRCDADAESLVYVRSDAAVEVIAK